MIPLKGIYEDGDVLNQPEGFARKIVNAVISKTNTYKNENGFDIFSSTYTGFSLCGVVNAKNGNKIIFSVKDSDGSSDIGILDINGVYTTKLNANLGFNVNYPITGEVDYNFKDEILVAFTDGLNSPKLINLNNISLPFNISDINLFPEYKEFIWDFTINENGGKLLSGVYFPIFKYRNLDSTETGWSSIGNPISINEEPSSIGYDKFDGCKSGTPTPKAINFTITNASNVFDSIVFGIIIKIDGILKAYEIREINVATSTVSFTYTGGENSKEISLISILSLPASYKTVKHLTQNEGILYGASITENSKIKFQKFASQIKLKWHSKLIKADDISTSFKNLENITKSKGFAHNEVYAFYIRLKIKGGNWTEAFHIPGPDNYNILIGNTGDFNTTLLSSDLTLQTDIDVSSTSKYFQMRDTTRNIINESPTSNYGDFGVFINEEEFYPNLDDYNGTIDYNGNAIIGGEDLRGKKVRHHKFPTFNKLNNGTYASGGYGKNYLDKLGIYIESIVIPTELQEQIEMYEICYAERTPDNSTIGGQSTLLYSSFPTTLPNTLGIPNFAFFGGQNENLGIDFSSAAGNWKQKWRAGVGGDVDELFYTGIDKRYCRFHSFDMLLDKPAINPDYILNNFKIRHDNLTSKFIAPANKASNRNWSYYINNLDNDCSVSIVQPNDLKRKIINFRYLPYGAIINKYANHGAEECVNFYLYDSAFSGNLDTNWYDVYGSAEGGVGTNDGRNLRFEESYISTLMVYKTSIYNNFITQKLVTTGKKILTTDTIGVTNLIYGGDVFISDYNFNTMGSTGFSGKLFWQLNGEDGPYGIRTNRRIICETRHNVNLRHEDILRDESKYYPKQNINFFPNSSYWLGAANRNFNPNFFAYNKDYTSINNLNSIVPYDPTKVFSEKDDYKIFRCASANKESRKISWKSFLANDYFTLQKNRGEITNIKGSENGLIINTKASIFLTKGKEQLKTDDFKINLGAGDIFQTYPQELIYDENGFAGCQHKFSCLLTPYGYIFFDEEKSHLFVMRDKPVPITTGKRDFIRKMKSVEVDNPFINKGYTLAWDEEFRRLLFSKIGVYTLSYSFDLESWTSEHTYKPEFLLNDRISLFSYKAKQFFKHNSPTKFGIYYDQVVNPMEIFIIFNKEKEENKKFYNVEWLTHVYKTTGELLRDVTFTSIFIGNRYQGTNEIALIPFDSEKTVEENFEIANTRKTKNTWHFNKFRDCVINNKLNILNDYNPITSNIDNNQSFELKKQFIDNYLIVKLAFNNQPINNLQAEFRVDNIETSYNKI